MPAIFRILLVLESLLFHGNLSEQLCVDSLLSGSHCLSVLLELLLSEYGEALNLSLLLKIVLVLLLLFALFLFFLLLLSVVLHALLREMCLLLADLLDPVDPCLLLLVLLELRLVLLAVDD